MIITKLSGGLGNQMFQYAIGRHLAIKNKSSLQLDLSELLRRDENISYTFRDFELGVFSLRNTIKPKLKHNRLILKLYNSVFTPRIIAEDGFNYHKEVLKAKGNLMLSGYWQTEKYFKEIESVIRKDFIFSQKPSKSNLTILKEIIDTNSVSIHFRRGDYLTNHSAMTMHETCSKDYYRKGIGLIRKNIQDPHFFIFSDEINWVKENFEMAGRHTFIDDNKGKQSFEDMRLMAACKHNIIANSSFSWWGAWLNSNINKTVIAPLKWFKNNTIDTSDLIPARWIKI